MAAGSTYTPIMTFTTTATTGSVTLGSIPQTYTDLVLILNAVPPGVSSGGTWTVNGTSNIYSDTLMAGLETSAYAISGFDINLASGYWITSGAAFTDSSALHLDVFHFQDYSNTTTYKTVLQRENPGKFGYVGIWAHLIRSTSAITSITMSAPSNLLTGSTLSLYGIKAA